MQDQNSPQKIHEKAVHVAKFYLDCERQLLAALIKVDQEQIYKQFGYTFLTPYCVKLLKLGEELARCLVRVIRKSREVPELAARVQDGSLPLYKAKVISSVITPKNKEEWFEKARTLSKAQLERAVAEVNGKDKKRVTLQLTHDAADKLERAREIVSTKSGEFASLEETVDAVLTEYLFRNDPVAKAKRSRDPSVEQQVTIRDEGRCQWTYSDGSRCGETKWLQRHHIVFRSAGGEDTVENMITLCGAHHRLLHEQETP